MEKRSVSVSLCLAVVLCMFPPLCGSVSNDPPDQPSSSGPEAEQANFLLARYVCGSGGVSLSVGTNYTHSATVGELLTGGALSANYSVRSGFWVTRFAAPTGVAQESRGTVPVAFLLYQNYPNPFNPRTNIQYALPIAARIDIEIYNLMGQRVRLLVDAELQAPGIKTAVWDGCNDQGLQVVSGFYVCRVSADAAGQSGNDQATFFRDSRKMLFVK